MNGRDVCKPYRRALAKPPMHFFCWEYVSHFFVSKKIILVITIYSLQIALRGGAPQDWGLVEFSNHTQAESTMRQMNNAILHGAKIRVSFYIPGVRAINIYMRLLNETVS